jgi:3-oxoadipate enol-lactonase
MPYANNQSVRLFYQTWGEQAGDDPIVFAHGAGGNAASWWQQVPWFADRHRVLAFDHRGFARSACPPEAFSRRYFVEDLVAIMDDAQIDRAVLVCQSMGGWTGLGMALEHPERVSALVMSHTPGGISTPEMDTIRRDAADRRPALTSPFAHWAVAPDFHEKHLALSHLYTQISGFNTSLDLSLMGRELQTPIDLARFSGYSIPTLFLTAEQDAIFPPEMIHLAAAQVPGAEVKMLGDAGHSSYFESADLFNHTVQEFLDGLE